MFDDDQGLFLAEYDPTQYPRVAVTADLVIFTVRDARLRVLMIKRASHPFRGLWAIPGGFVHAGDADKSGESLKEAAHRILAEETGLPIGSAYLEQLYTYGACERDPRMRVISVAWFALINPDLAPLVAAGREASDLKWCSVEQIPTNMAFDHSQILMDGLERIRGKLDYSTVAFDLVPETFTIADLRGVHEAILGTTCDAGNFRRKFLRLIDDGLVEQAPGRRMTTGKPAKVFRFVRRKA